MVAHFYRLAILSALLVNREQIRSGFIADDEGVAVLKVVVAHKTFGKYNRTITASSNRGIRGFIWWKSTIRRGRSVWARQWETCVTVFAGVIVIGFWVMGLFRKYFDVSSTKVAMSRSMLTTSSLPFRWMVNVLSDRLSTLKGPS